MTMRDLHDRLRAIAGEARPSSDFDLNPTKEPDHTTARPAAVLVAVVENETDPNLLFTTRASGLRHHPGQVAFPGGKVEAEDRGTVEAALREAEEEIALPRENVEIFGEMAPHRTVTGFSVTPVLGWVRENFSPRPQAGEVAEVFRVPFRHIEALGNYRIESRYFRGVRRYYYVIPYGPYYVWGATAHILHRLAEALNS